MRPLGLLAHPTHAIQSIPKPARDRCRDLRAAAKQQQHAPWASDQQQPARCPFSGGRNAFLRSLQQPRQRQQCSSGALTPLGKAGGAEFATSSLWLSAGSSGQSMPGRLVSGLRKLADLDEFLVELAHEMPHELGLKRSALDNPARRAEVSVAELSSLDAQTECLEMFLEYLPRRYPSLYSVQGSGSAQTITVGPTGEVHVVADYVRAPLELCARIVQEDLVLMRPEGPSPSGPSPAPQPHVMSAAVVVFSFGGLRSKLSQPLRAIHAPVPGFEQQLLALLNRTFSGIRPGTPLWRNNWGLADTGNLDTPLYGEAAGYARRPAQDLHPDQLWLKTEYQTLRRLPSSNHILFTVRTMVEPLSALKANGDGAAAAAAAELASSLRGMAPAMRAYKGLGVPSAAEPCLHTWKGPARLQADVSAAAAAGISCSLHGVTPATRAYKDLRAPGAAERESTLCWRTWKGPALLESPSRQGCNLMVPPAAADVACSLCGLAPVAMHALGGLGMPGTSEAVRGRVWLG